MEIFVAYVEISRHQVGNDVGAVKAGDNADDGIDILVAVCVKISGQDSAAEADGQQVDLIVAGLPLDHVDILVKLLCRLHRVADEVEGVEIGVICPDNIDYSLHGDHSVDPVDLVLGHLGERVIPSLSLEVVDIVALIVALLDRECGRGGFISDLVEQDIMLSRYCRKQ